MKKLLNWLLALFKHESDASFKERWRCKHERIDRETFSRMVAAMGPIRVDAITTDKIAAPELTDALGPQIKLGCRDPLAILATAQQLTDEELKAFNEPGHFQVISIQPYLIVSEELDKLVEAADELVDSIYRDGSMRNSRALAQAVKELVSKHVEDLRKHKLIRIVSETDRRPNESEADCIARLLEMARNK